MAVLHRFYNTLYPDSSPFCVSGGGGSQVTMISVELGASVLMFSGAAVGAGINLLSSLTLYSIGYF